MVSFFKKKTKYILTLPVVIFQLLLVVFPLIYTLNTSLYKTTLSSTELPEFVGLNNYALLMQDARFWESVGRTVKFTVICLFFEMIIGIAIALFLNRNFIGKNIVKTAILMPIVATPVAISVTFTLIYDPVRGIANMLLKQIGIPAQTWLASKSTALYSVMLVDIWEWTPMITLIMIAGLASIPYDPIEAAIADGANAFQRTFRVVIPMLAPTILVAATLRLVDLIRTFDIIFSMTAGGPGTSTETMNIYGYIYGFQYFDFGMSSAILIVFFFFVVTIATIFIWLRNRYGRIG